MIVLYSTNCPKCKVLEEKLKNNNLSFDVVVGEEAEKAIRNLGYTSAPVVKVNKEIMSFEAAIKWLNAKTYA